MAESKTIDKISSEVITGKPHNVILFNDESHDMQEVAAQIIKAIHCSNQRALQIMMEAHEKGRAIVFSGGLERCEHVASVLEEIRLGTKIEQV